MNKHYVIIGVTTIILLLLGVFAYSESFQTPQEVKPSLAKNVDGKSTDTPYIKEYMKKYQNFSNVKFKEGRKEVMLTSKRAGKDVSGLVFDNKQYAVHVVGCNEKKGTCNFRVNGVLFKDISPDSKDTINLNGKNSLKVKSIEFDYCYGKRFCDLHYEAVDRVKIQVNS